MEKKAIKKPNPAKVCIDASKFSYICEHLDNNVDYAFGCCDKPVEQMAMEDVVEWKNVNYVCFAGYANAVNDFKKKQNKDPNRIFFKLTIHQKGRDMLTDEQRARWISLAKMHGLIPPHIMEDSLGEGDGKHGMKEGVLYGRFIIDLNIPSSLLYVYLSTLRNLREDPGLPKVVIHLVDDCGMNFYAAYIFGSRIALNTVGHHILGSTYRPYGRAYMSDKEASEKIGTEVKISPKIANSLRRFVHDPAKYDSNKAFNPIRLCSSAIIEKINKATRSDELTFRQLLDKNVVKAIMSLTDEDYITHMKAFSDKNSKVKKMEVGA